MRTEELRRRVAACAFDGERPGKIYACRFPCGFRNHEGIIIPLEEGQSGDGENAALSRDAAPRSKGDYPELGRWVKAYCNLRCTRFGDI